MLLRIVNINKKYISGKAYFQALKDISFEIDEGEFVAISGPSGSGKTTLLNIIGCIDKPDSGEVILDGRSLKARTPDELASLRREYLGFIFQTYNLIPVLTAYENVELPLRLLRRFKEDEMRKKVEDALKKVGIYEMRDRKPLELSGGEQQRVSIARAIVKEPRLVLADEPTANLDTENGKNIVQIMREMNKNEKITFIFSTHDLLILQYANRIISLRDGKIVDDVRK
uniref:ABC transporter ATP-binding protein n=1 Tax=candidate division WOR-3 bacterium TaxID=2052148 RepID=A0A7C4UH20_UNCW3